MISIRNLFRARLMLAGLLGATSACATQGEDDAAGAAHQEALIAADQETAAGAPAAIAEALGIVIDTSAVRAILDPLATYPVVTDPCFTAAISAGDRSVTIDFSGCGQEGLDGTVTVTLIPGGIEVSFNEGFSAGEWAITGTVRALRGGAGSYQAASLGTILAVNEGSEDVPTVTAEISFSATLNASAAVDPDAERSIVGVYARLVVTGNGSGTVTLTGQEPTDMAFVLGGTSAETAGHAFGNYEGTYDAPLVWRLPFDAACACPSEGAIAARFSGLHAFEIELRDDGLLGFSITAPVSASVVVTFVGCGMVPGIDAEAEPVTFPMEDLRASCKAANPADSLDYLCDRYIDGDITISGEELATGIEEKLAGFITCGSEE